MKKGIKVGSSINLCIGIILLANGVFGTEYSRYFQLAVSALLFITCLVAIRPSQLIMDISKISLYILSLAMGLAALSLLTHIFTTGEVLSRGMNILVCSLFALYCIGYRSYLSKISHAEEPRNNSD